MKPLSVVKRRIYLSLSAVAFLICIPILILYATGYRIGDAMNLIKTGGIFIAVPYSGVEVSVDEKVVKQTGVFQKNAFVQNLRPGEYTVSVKKEKYQDWSKTLTVFPKTVTEGYPFLILSEPLLTEIPQYLDGEIATSTKSATTTGKINSQYSQVVSLFAPISATSTASTSEIIKLRRKLSVENKKDLLSITWTGDKNEIPYYFCENEICRTEIRIVSNTPITTFDFLPGRDDVIVYRNSNGIFVSEIDNRGVQNVSVLAEGAKLDFRVSNGETIYIKKDKQYFSVSY